jgi:cytochrome c-type protein NapC
MPNFAALEVAFIAVVFALSLLLVLRAELTRMQGGKIMAFFALFLLPCLAMWTAYSQHLQRAESTQFCLSCHVMTNFGRSLYIDDRSYVPAFHFQNNLVPRDAACYTCHTDYTMFGGVHSKWRGLHHIYIEYLGHIPKPEDINLYQPFNNRECLHCHAGARSFTEAAPHHKTPEMLAAITSNKLSCMSSNCHEFVHDVANLKDDTFWKGGN